MCEYLSCKLFCAEKSIADNVLRSSAAELDSSDDDYSLEHVCWDPKDGELCLCRLKPGEILVEDRRDTDVQIVLQT